MISRSDVVDSVGTGRPIDDAEMFEDRKQSCWRLKSNVHDVDVIVSEVSSCSQNVHVMRSVAKIIFNQFLISEID